MFNWFSSSPKKTAGIGKIESDFIVMFQTASQEFQLACQVALYGRNANSVREEISDYDKAVNKAERRIRKELVIHCSVRGLIDPESLVMMSIAKDAERLGDYAKNIYDMGELAPMLPQGEEREQLLILDMMIRKLFARSTDALQNHDEELARQVIIECKWAGEQCDKITQKLLTLETPSRRTASDVLMFRFMKRTLSHIRNICSSVVQPLHKLDFTKKITKKSTIEGDLLSRKAEFQVDLDKEALLWKV